MLTLKQEKLILMKWLSVPRVADQNHGASKSATGYIAQKNVRPPIFSIKSCSHTGMIT